MIATHKELSKVITVSKEQEKKYICKDCGCDFSNAEWFDGDYCGDDESDFEGYNCLDCFEEKNR